MHWSFVLRIMHILSSFDAFERVFILWSCPCDSFLSSHLSVKLYYVWCFILFPLCVVFNGIVNFFLILICLILNCCIVRFCHDIVCIYFSVLLFFRIRCLFVRYYSIVLFSLWIFCFFLIRYFLFGPNVVGMCFLALLSFFMFR